MRYVPLALSILALLPSTLAGSAPPPPTDVGALAVDPVDTLITWSPPTQDPTLTYNVYGVSGTSTLYLTSTTGLGALVVSGYDGYAVTAVLGGVESDPAFTADACLNSSLTPPPPSFNVDPNCNAGFFFHVAVPKA